MDDYGPCPICGGGSAVESGYDRSVGQVSCGGTCGWALPTDTWRRLSDAAALARAVERLSSIASINVGMAGGMFLATCGPRGAFGATAAAALVALAGEVDRGE